MLTCKSFDSLFSVYDLNKRAYNLLVYGPENAMNIPFVDRGLFSANCPRSFRERVIWFLGARRGIHRQLLDITADTQLY